MRSHVVITGTGRAGTTFLVELLTQLRLDTGFSVENMASAKYPDARAGLEHDIRENNCPYIVKSPWFCDHADEVVARPDIAIDHVFIPMRDLPAAAESRRYVSRVSAAKLPLLKRLRRLFKRKSFPGGLWITRSGKPGKQEEILLRQVYQMMWAVADTNTPVTLLRFPRTVKDPGYLYDKLKPILGGIGYPEFSVAYEKVVHPELVHQFSPRDR